MDSATFHRAGTASETHELRYSGPAWATHEDSDTFGTATRIWVSAAGLDSQSARLVRRPDVSWREYYYLRDHFPLQNFPSHRGVSLE